MHFSYDLEGTLTEEEYLVDDILSRLRDKLKKHNYNIVIHDYFDNQVRSHE